MEYIACSLGVKLLYRILILSFLSSTLLLPGQLRLEIGLYGFRMKVREDIICELVHPYRYMSSLSCLVYI